MGYELWVLYDQDYVHGDFDATEFKFVRKLTDVEAEVLRMELIEAETLILLRQNSSRLRVILMTGLVARLRHTGIPILVGSPKVLDVVIREVEDEEDFGPNLD